MGWVTRRASCEERRKNVARNPPMKAAAHGKNNTKS
jgi:hypothetical protein